MFVALSLFGAVWGIHTVVNHLLEKCFECRCRDSVLTVSCGPNDKPSPNNHDDSTFTTITSCSLMTWQFVVPSLGWLSNLLERLSDLQLGDKKVTLNHLGLKYLFQVLDVTLWGIYRFLFLFQYQFWVY